MLAGALVWPDLEAICNTVEEWLICWQLSPVQPLPQGAGADLVADLLSRLDASGCPLTDLQSGDVLAFPVQFLETLLPEDLG